MNENLSTFGPHSFDHAVPVVRWRASDFWTAAADLISRGECSLDDFPEKTRESIAILLASEES